MGKKAKEEVARRVETSGGLEHIVQTRSIEDDCPLPTPEELQRYKDVDPKIIDFFIQSASQEQQHRHSMNDKSVELLAGYHLQKYRITRFALMIMLAVVVIGAVIAISCFALGYEVTGGIFAGLDLVAILTVISGLIKGYGAKDNPTPNTEDNTN